MSDLARWALVAHRRQRSAKHYGDYDQFCAYCGEDWPCTVSQLALEALNVRYNPDLRGYVDNTTGKLVIGDEELAPPQE